MPEKFQMPALMFTFVVNSIGTESSRYPVSIGIAGSSQQLWHRLITPEESWSTRDEVAEALMDITHQDLLAQGKSAAQLCLELNQIFEGQQLLTENLGQVEMINQIFEAAGQGMTFSVRHIDEVMSKEEALAVVKSIALEDRTYKADQDAKTLRDVIVLHFT